MGAVLLGAVLSISFYVHSEDTENPPEESAPGALDADTAVPDLDAICPPSRRKPVFQRKSIVMKDGHFGEGRMELLPDVLVLRLNGTAFERGYQHGAMLKHEIGTRLLMIKKDYEGNLAVLRMSSWLRYRFSWSSSVRGYIRGMAKGSGARLSDLAMLSFIAPGNYPSVPIRRSPGELDFPSWHVEATSTEEGKRYLVITRPGLSGALAVLDGNACKVADSDNREGLLFPPFDEHLREDGITEECSFELASALGPVSVLLEPGPGAVCIQRKDKTPGAIDFETGRWRPSCEACLREE